MPAKRWIHSVPVADNLPAADGIFIHDLGVNPLSVVLLVLRPLNDTGTLANFPSYRAICDAVNRVTITVDGVSVFSMSGGDAAALAYWRHGIIPPQATHIDTNNDRRCVVLPILLGRSAYDEDSCLPGFQRGRLKIELDLDIADTGYDGLRYSIETIEMPGASPKLWERKVSLTQTMVVGDNDIPMPLGNMVRGVLAFGTTGFAGATPAPTLGRLSVRADNTEWLFAATDFEVAHMLHSLVGRQPPFMDAHKHRVTTDGNVQTELATLGGPYDVGTLWQLYCYLDFDFNRDDEYTIDTKGMSKLDLHVNAEAANAARIVTIEACSPKILTQLSGG